VTPAGTLEPTARTASKSNAERNRVATKRKLIEVSLPLEEINAQSAREKSIRHGHPSTLHLWWARRPLATARAVLFAQLVDDPSNFVDDYRTEAESKGYEDPEAWAEHRVKQERQRLFDLIIKMVDWDNLNDEELFDQVRAEIMRSTNNNPPAILDPFAGGGTIPLEAQRLGLEAHASDLNPVAVLINKALIEIPPKFAGHEPVFPSAAGQRNAWPKATGLAEDVRRYGQWMRDEAQLRIGHLYPKATLPDGSKATVIAWIWARTVTCPNPACGIEMPLVRSWWLGKKEGKEAFIVPTVVSGHVEYQIGHDSRLAPTAADDGTVGRRGATCVSCGTAVALTYIRNQGKSVGLGRALMATVAEGNRSRTYLAPDDIARDTADVPEPASIPSGTLASNPRDFKTPNYGMTTFASLFTNRQLTALTIFSDLVSQAREHVLADALAAGIAEGTRLEAGGTDASAYADAVATYLAFPISRMANKLSSLCSWDSSPKMESVRGLFARQAIPMAWDYAEANPFAGSSGDFIEDVAWVERVVDRLPATIPAEAKISDAASRSYAAALISTDPPYYDNIGYADLSDFFYVWLRRSLQPVHPELLGTMLVPKAEELVANPYRNGGPDGAKQFFETGFEHVFAHARESASDDYPITVYYAFKQSETDEGGQSSTGWETILGSMVHAGWTVTATWPVRSELSNRMIASGTNALASSVVLALRPRAADAAVTDRRGFIAAMKRELGPALRELQQGGIAPVDLPQSAIGPGMAVFSRYAKVIESDGSEMSVRSALARINEVLDELLTEQEGDFDPTTRFAIAWYRGNGYDAGAFGDAENLARARATAVTVMERGGILSARAGKVQLHRPVDLPEDYDVVSDQHTSAWEALQHAIRIQETMGIPAAGAFLHEASRRPDGAVDLDLVKELAYLLFQVAEKNGWTKDAISFNGVATSWSELLDAGRTAAPTNTAATLDFDALGD
jgi:putative DNA methylase